MQEVTRTTGRNDCIDVLRGLAALLVVLSHYLPYWEEHLGQPPVVVPGEWGLYAVWLFFVISGYVIFATLERSRSVLEFVVLRASRLYPAYWSTMALAAGIGALVFGQKPWLTGLLVNATMFQEFLGFGNVDNVYWSLTVELVFYAISALILALGLKHRPEPVVAVWLTFSCIWAATARTPSAMERDTISLLLAVDYAPYFTCGILFFRATLHNWSVGRIALLLFAMATEFLIREWNGLLIMLTILAIFALARSGRLTFLVSPLTLWLGAISYPLYLVHRNLGHYVLTWLHDVGVGSITATFVAVLGALGLATAVHYWIEQPGMRVIRESYRRMYTATGANPGNRL